jgi:hypothetical protein
MTDDNVLYDSGKLKKPYGVNRGFVAGNKGFNIFRIRSVKHGAKSWRGSPPIVLEIHSSVSSNMADRVAWGAYPPRAATEIRMTKEEAGHLLIALLAAMNPRED